MLEMVQLHRDHKGTARWVEPALERVRSMAARWGTDAEALVDTTWKLFAERSKLLGLWIGLEGDQVRGHMLADVRMWDGKAVVWLLQTETDQPVTRVYRDYVLTRLDEWAAETAKAMSLTLDTIVMSTPRMVDAWARLSGFEPYRVLHRRKIAVRKP